MKAAAALMAILAFGASSASAVEIKKDGWLFPQPAKAEKKAIRTLDATERIPGRETVVKVYKRSDGVVFDTFEVEGEVYACQFHVKGKDGQPPTVYAIVDTDGDGVYESKYAAGEFPRVPDWVIKRYYKKQGAGKDPGPSADAHPEQ